MAELFITLLNNSLAAGVLVLVVLLLRTVFRRLPKATVCLLWGLAALRLILPFSIESAVSLLPSAEPIPQEILYAETPKVSTGIPALNAVVNPAIASSLSPRIGDSVNPAQVFFFVASWIWAIGCGAMLLYAVISCIRVARRVREAMMTEKNVYLCDRIDTPFIFGFFRPCIYLPSTIGETEKQYVLAHERTHIKRGDHLWKPLGYLLLTVYWINPLLWAGYILLCRDIEAACDERVIGSAEDMADYKKAYTEALVSLSAPPRFTSVCPLAFGETGVRSRVKRILNYRRPTFWIILLSIVLCIAAAVCFLTDRPTKEPSTESGITEKWFDVDDGDEMVWDGRREISLDEYPDVTFRVFSEKLEAVTDADIKPLYTGMPIWSVYFCDLNGDGYRELCSTVSIGSGIVDERIRVYDYANEKQYELEDREHGISYLLHCMNGVLFAEKRQLETIPLAIGRLYLEGDRLMMGEDTSALVDYTVNDDGTYTAENGITYRYMLLLSGRHPNAVCDSYYVVLSNNESLSFERVSESLFTSDSEKFLDRNEAVIVRIGTLNEDIPPEHTTAEEVAPEDAAIPYTSTVAYAGSYDGFPFMGENSEKLYISSVCHLPIVHCTKTDDIEKLIKRIDEPERLSQGYNEMPSFNEAAARYDEHFFQDHDLLVAYLSASSGSFRFDVSEVHRYGDSCLVTVDQLNHPGTYTCDEAGWWVFAEVDKSLLEGCTEYDAVLQR